MVVRYDLLLIKFWMIWVMCSLANLWGFKKKKRCSILGYRKSRGLFLGMV